MTDYRALAAADAKKYGLDPNIFIRQIQQESGFNPNALSPAGAEGIAQFMPATAKGYGINPWDPAQALNAAAQYDVSSLHQYGGDWAKALAAYNAGGGAVNTAIARGGKNWQRYLPAETQNYIKTILGGTTTPTPTTSAFSTASQGTGGTIANDSVASLLGLLGIPNPASVEEFMLRGGLVIVGAILVIIGLAVLFSQKVMKTAQQGASQIIGKVPE